VPTYELRPRFDRDHRRLTAADKAAFIKSVSQFVADLRSGRGGFRPSLRVHSVDARRGVSSISFGADLRATFSYGDELTGDAHIIWRRVGSHRVYREP